MLEAFFATRRFRGLLVFIHRHDEAFNYEGQGWGPSPSSPRAVPSANQILCEVHDKGATTPIFRVVCVCVCVVCLRCEHGKALFSERTTAHHSCTQFVCRYSQPSNAVRPTAPTIHTKASPPDDSPSGCRPIQNSSGIKTGSKENRL